MRCICRKLGGVRSSDPVQLSDLAEFFRDLAELRARESLSALIGVLSFRSLRRSFRVTFCSPQLGLLFLEFLERQLSDLGPSIVITITLHLSPLWLINYSLFLDEVATVFSKPSHFFAGPTWPLAPIATQDAYSNSRLSHSRSTGHQSPPYRPVYTPAVLSVSL